MQSDATMHTPARGGWSRWEEWTGIAFVVLFVGSFFVEGNSPMDSDPDKTWVAYYADRGNRIGALLAGFMLLFAALALITFLTSLWMRIVSARRPEMVSPLPLIAAGVAGAGIGVGAIALATIPGAMIFGNLREPGVDTLRLASDLSFPMFGVLGMYAAALSVAVLGVQAHAVGLFGQRMKVFSLLMAAILLASFMFFPIVALAIWLIVVTVLLKRRPRAVSSADPALAPS